MIVRDILPLYWFCVSVIYATSTDGVTSQHRGQVTFQHTVVVTSSSGTEDTLVADNVTSKQYVGSTINTNTTSADIGDVHRKLDSRQIVAIAFATIVIIVAIVMVVTWKCLLPLRTAHASLASMNYKKLQEDRL